MNKILTALAVGMCFIVLSMAFSQGYLLGPGDTLTITVWGYDQLSATVTVGPDGTIIYPLVGEINVQGLTISQLTDKLTKSLAEFVKTPYVFVTLKEFKGTKVYVLGQVQRPGVYQLKSGLTIVDAVAQAGGPTNRADLKRALVKRANKETIPVDLEKVMLKGDLEQNIILQTDDTVIIPELRNEITILGQVNRPGRYEIKEEDTLLDAITSAGGLSLTSAPKKAIITRENKQIMQVDLEDLLVRGNLVVNVTLQPGDVIFIPEPKTEFTIVGQVERPGSYKATEGIKILDVIAIAGGVTKQADLRKAVVIREGEESLPLDLKKILEDGDLSQNIAIKSGDVIFLPPAKKRIYVFGQVNHPGAFDLKEEDRILEALASAGGVTREAALEKAGIVRMAEGKPTIVPVNLNKMMHKADISQNVPLMDGDIIYVPQKTRPINWQEVVTYIYGVELLLRIFPSWRPK